MRNTHIRDFFLIREFSVVENVMIPGLNSLGMFNWFGGKRELRKKAESLLADVGIADKAHYDVRKLSGGEKQRVAIARALINDPIVVLCDEPTGNLDEDTEEGIKGLFSDLNKKTNTAFVIVSHNTGLLEICSRRYRLTHGKLAQQ